MITINLSKDNYQQYAPFDIVAYHELSVAIDRTKRVFKFEEGVPRHEIFHYPKGATISEAFKEGEWHRQHTGLGTEMLVHDSIWEKFQQRIAGLTIQEIRRTCRELVLDILD